MDYPKFIVSNQKEESISIQRVKYELWMPLLLRIANCKGHISRVKSGYFRKHVNSDRDINTFYTSGFGVIG